MRDEIHVRDEVCKAEWMFGRRMGWGEAEGRTSGFIIEIFWEGKTVVYLPPPVSFTQPLPLPPVSLYSLLVSP